MPDWLIAVLREGGLLAVSVVSLTIAGVMFKAYVSLVLAVIAMSRADADADAKTVAALEKHAALAEKTLAVASAIHEFVKLQDAVNSRRGRS